MIDFVWKIRGLLALFLLLMLAGCGGKVVSFNATSDNGECRQLWQEFEEVIYARQVADNTAVRVHGFPYLRSTRFLEALAGMTETQEEQAFVLEEMRHLDLEKRALELTRIPENVVDTLVGHHPGAEQTSLAQTLAACSQDFLAGDKKNPDFFDRVRRGIDLDRDYSLWLRSVGLYPLTSLVVDYLAAKAQAEMVAQLSTPPLEEGAEDLITFWPLEQGSISSADLADLLSRNRHQPMFSLDLSGPDLIDLVRKFAPVLSMANGAAQNRFGRIVRSQKGFAVDGHDPVVYYYLSQTFVQGIPALQINYAIWFTERTDPAPWFEHGNLDGLLFRVTLNGQGQPVFVDVTFQCGCYHFVLFNDDLVSGKRPDPKGFQPFVGGRLPALQDRERLHFTVTSGWHQIARLEATGVVDKQPTYQLLPYEGLEYFHDGDEVVSLFDNQGRVPGTNRLERFFLFPMGIPKVGAMRQRGRQPITLIGRAYLDDPYLFDDAFVYQYPLPDRAELLATEEARQKVAAGKEAVGSKAPMTKKVQEGQ
ncbi:MAG: hypothetical protein KKD73_03830 [Proteobacteria bacterium]|nr:hypothetical protein [Pseudomonadota bacterium]MBU1639750.1 hypothetical protein [Pseudomonadota bacterium]